MKKLIISGVFCSVLLLGGFQVASAEETTTTSVKSQSEMLAQIEQLMKLIADLQAKLSAARGEIQELVSDLKEGAQGDDVKKVQEILASDPSLFSVAPTGYFGPLTKAALVKFQVKFGLAPTGELDAETRAVMKELRAERKNGLVPAGLATSAEAHERVKARLQAKWGDCVWGEKFRASDCKKGKDKVKDHDDDDDDNATTTRAEAEDAIEEAEEAIADLEADIAEMEENDADADDIEEAEEMLEEAEEELAEAKEAFDDEEYEDAEEAAEEVLEIINGDDDDDDDDEDDDDDDDDDDEDDDDDDDEEDDD